MISSKGVSVGILTARYVMVPLQTLSNGGLYQPFILSCVIGLLSIIGCLCMQYFEYKLHSHDSKPWFLQNTHSTANERQFSDVISLPWHIWFLIMLCLFFIQNLSYFCVRVCVVCVCVCVCVCTFAAVYFLNPSFLWLLRNFAITCHLSKFVLKKQK